MKPRLAVLAVACLIAGCAPVGSPQFNANPIVPASGSNAPAIDPIAVKWLARGEWQDRESVRAGTACRDIFLDLLFSSHGKSLEISRKGALGDLFVFFVTGGASAVYAGKEIAASVRSDGARITIEAAKEGNTSRLILEPTGADSMLVVSDIPPAPEKKESGLRGKTLTLCAK